MQGSAIRRVIPIVFVASLAVWMITLSFGYVWDDLPTIVTNLSLLDGATGWRAFTHDFWGLHDVAQVSGYWRPVPTVLYLITAKVFGLQAAWAFHALNLLTHTGVVLLVTLLLRKLGLDGLCLLFGSLFFALHPMSAETVSFVSALPDLTAAFFGLLGLWLGLNDRPLKRMMGLFFFLVALLCKESAIAFPLLWLAWLWIDGKGIRRPSVIEIILIALTVLGYGVLHWSVTGASGVGSLWGGSWGTHLGTVVRLVPFAILLTIFPFSSTPTRSFPLSSGASDPLAWAALLTLAGLFFLAWTTRKRHGWLGIGLGLFFVFWLPYSNLIPSEGLMADRYLYLPAIGSSFLLASLVGVNVKRNWLRRAFPALLTGFGLIWGTWAIWFALPWRSEETLWKRAVEVSPTVSMAWSEYGRVLLEKGEAQHAVPHLKRALQLQKANPGAEFNLALAFTAMEKFDEAETVLNNLLVKHSGDAKVWDLASTVRFQQGKQVGAVQAGQKAMELDPNNWKYAFNLGTVYLQVRKYVESRDVLKVATRLAPNRAEVWMNVSAAHFYLGDWREAIAGYRTVLDKWPGHVRAQENLTIAQAMLEKGSGK